jgi:hypothetical protein
MAFLDFLSQPIGGYTQGPTMSGQAGVAQSNYTWGQLAGALAQQSNSPSGRQLGGLMSNNYGMNNQGYIYSLPQSGQQEKPKQDSTGQILSALASILLL